MVYNCQICTNEYNLKDNLPKILGKCGHTICKTCLSYQIESLKKSNLSFEKWLLKCPFDNTTYLIKKKSTVEDFPRNFFLIDLIQIKLKKNGHRVIVKKKNSVKKKEILAPKTLRQKYEEDYGVKLDKEKFKKQEDFRKKQSKKKLKKNIKVYVSDKHVKFFNKNLNSLKQKIINKKVTKNFIEKTKYDLKNKKINFLKNKTNFDQLFNNLKKQKLKKSFNTPNKIIKDKNKSKINLVKKKSKAKREVKTKKQNRLVNFKRKKSKIFSSKKKLKKSSIKKIKKILNKKSLLKKFRKDLKMLSKSKKKKKRDKIIIKNGKKLNLLERIKNKLNRKKSVNTNLYNTQYEDSQTNSVILNYDQRQSNLNKNDNHIKENNLVYSESEFSLNNNQKKKLKIPKFIYPEEISLKLKKPSIYTKNKIKTNFSVDKKNNSINMNSNEYFRYSNLNSQNEKIRYSQTPEITSKKIVIKPSASYFYNFSEKNNYNIQNQKKEILNLKKNQSKIFRFSQSNLVNNIISPNHNIVKEKIVRVSKRTSANSYIKVYLK